MKLFPVLASTYIQGAGTDYLIEMYDELIKGTEKNDFKLMEALHHISAALKTITTQQAVDGIALIR